MIEAYLDTSVVMRIILQEPDPLPEWDALEFGVSSELLRIECHRTIERLWRQHHLDEEEVERYRAEVNALLRNLEIRPIDGKIVARAVKPFPTYVATLDSIHLATALLYRRSQRDDHRPILFATHDRQLAKAATALHFEVIGAAA